MRDRKLAARYARALLATLSDDRAAKPAEEFLHALVAAMERSPELRDVVLNPAVARTARKAVLTTLADQHNAPRQVRSFLAIVVEHGRTAHLAEIARAFGEAREQAAGIVPVTLETAAPLPSDLVQRARAVLEKLTGRKVRMRVAVEPSHLGGAVARIGSRVYDGSLKTQLGILRRRMAAE